MIVKVKATMSDGKTIVNEILRENIYQNPNLLTYNYPTPDLSETATSFIDAVDKFNYGLLSKTEFTEYLYRLYGNGTKQIFEGSKEFWITFYEDGPIGLIELIF